MVNRHVSGAHYGLRDWLAQRITAVVMILYTVLFVVMLLKMPQFDYAGWRSVWMAPLMRYATLLFLLCLFRVRYNARPARFWCAPVTLESL